MFSLISIQPFLFVCSFVGIRGELFICNPFFFLVLFFYVKGYTKGSLICVHMYCKNICICHVLICKCYQWWSQVKSLTECLTPTKSNFSSFCVGFYWEFSKNSFLNFIYFIHFTKELLSREYNSNAHNILIKKYEIAGGKQNFSTIKAGGKLHVLFIIIPSYF